MSAFVTVAEVLVDLLNLSNLEGTFSTSDDFFTSCYQKIFVPLGAVAFFPIDTADVAEFGFTEASIPVVSQTLHLHIAMLGAYVI